MWHNTVSILLSFSSSMCLGCLNQDSSQKPLNSDAYSPYSFTDVCDLKLELVEVGLPVTVLQWIAFVKHRIGLL